MADRKREKERLGRPCLEMRFGIHTGPVVAGVVGSRKFADDIWGDAVNVAAFMESGGQVGRVNVSDATFALITDHSRCTPRDKRAIKHGVEVEMYFVDGPKGP